MTYATVRLQDLQSQMPTEWRLTLVLPQKVQTYLACWVISIFFTDFRREAPYLHTLKSALVSLASHATSSIAAPTLLLAQPWIVLGVVDAKGRSHRVLKRYWESQVRDQEQCVESGDEMR